MNFTPDLSGLESLANFDIVTKLNQQLFSWLPIALIFLFLILWFLLIGITTGGRYKKTIQKGEFWLLMAGLLIALVLEILNIFYPFWIKLLS